MSAALSFALGMLAGGAVLAIALVLIGGALVRAASEELDRVVFPRQSRAPETPEDKARRAQR